MTLELTEDGRSVCGAEPNEFGNEELGWVADEHKRDKPNARETEVYTFEYLLCASSRYFPFSSSAISFRSFCPPYLTTVWTMRLASCLHTISFTLPRMMSISSWMCCVRSFLDRFFWRAMVHARFASVRRAEWGLAALRCAKSTRCSL